MNHNVSVSNDRKYIVLKATGIINRLLVIQYFIEAHTLGKQEGINRYLVNFTEIGRAHV